MVVFLDGGDVMIKLLILFLFIIWILGCGELKSIQPHNCSVSKVNDLTTVTCPDGTVSTIHDGSDGANGLSGDRGAPGLTTMVQQASADVSLCPAGGVVLNIGLDMNYDTILNLNEITSTAVICNGMSNPSQFEPVGLVMPCVHDPMHPTDSELADPSYEIFVKLSGGELLASFSDNVSGYNTHFALVPAGSFMSTGKTNCHFNVDNQGVITNAGI